MESKRVWNHQWVNGKDQRIRHEWKSREGNTPLQNNNPTLVATLPNQNNNINNTNNNSKYLITK